MNEKLTFGQSNNASFSLVKLEIVIEFGGLVEPLLISEKEVSGEVFRFDQSIINLEEYCLSIVFRVK